MSRRTLTRSSAMILAAAAAAALWAGPVFAADKTVTIQNMAFQQGSVTVDVGDTVTWQNDDVRGHTATADSGTFDTGTIAVGGSASVTFDTAGSFPYHCTIHPDMTATVVVQAAAASPSAAPSSNPAPSSGGSGGSGGTKTPPPTDTTAATPASALVTTIVTILALGLIAIAAMSLIALRLRPAEETEKDR